MDDVRDDDPGRGLSRRDVLRRGAAVGGALVWTVPVVQSVTPSAFAAGSPAVKGVKKPRPDTEVEGTKLPHTGADFPVAQVVAAGTALVAGGAAVVARSRRTATPDGSPDDGVAESVESADTPDEA
jgi:LPXTG-motif cell wall-anchored protein